MSEQLLTLDEAAEMLATTRSSVRRWAVDGRLAAVQLPGKRWRIKKSAVNALIDGTAVRPDSAEPAA